MLQTMSSCTYFVASSLALLYFLISAATAHFIPCSEAFFALTQKRQLSNCKQLTTLGAEFGWEINQKNRTQIKIIFGARLHDDMGWLAWGVNPRESPQMVGTRAIIGIRLPNGSLTIDTYNITSDTKLGCNLEPSEIDVEFKERTIEYVSTFFTIQATMGLPSRYNITKLNHVWQVGYEAVETQPKMHPAHLQNVDSTETIDLLTGLGQQVGEHRHQLRVVHGILNIVGWGTFLPVGVIIARYFKYPIGLKFWWYGFHISCQIAGYIVGTAGWIVGLSLGKASEYYSFRTHAMFAAFIFTFATLQMLALRLRPEKGDEYRKYWNIYHHFLGYALLVVISINIFHGIDILKAHKIWKWAYVGILGAFAIIVTFLEIYTWTRFLLERAKAKDRTPPQQPPPPPQQQQRQ